MKSFRDVSGTEFPESWQALKSSILHWASTFSHNIFLDSCETDLDRYGEYDFLVAVGAEKELRSLEELESYAGNWRFGIFAYSLKDQLEPKLSSSLPHTIPFPMLSFFVPQTVIWKKKSENKLVIQSDEPSLVWQAIRKQIGSEEIVLRDFTGFSSSFSRGKYLETILKLKDQIRNGEVYEINLSQEFIASGNINHPASFWEALTRISPVPFAAYARLGDIHVMSASPERFLQSKAGRLLTQPIKGTIQRGKDPKEDNDLKTSLENSLKDKSENVMIVDLSRNDLNRSALPGTVEVPELFEVRTFPKVHHLVSTITGLKDPDISSLQVIKNTFPPGSMTGAPKLRAIQLIEDHELTSRGIYSGSIGFFSPNDDFDFNVVIRSLVYNHSTQKISYHVGGAITWDSDPEAEYEETLVKAAAISELFGKFDFRKGVAKK